MPADAARPVSELQTSAPELVRRAQRKGAVPLTRYGKTVAYLVSPESRRRQEELELAANRALWAIDIARGMRDLEQGDVMEWDEVYETLARELSQ
jgi:antitoxin (DNA-binding transcriptional repressor) of toxin-antitoxin stability system